ncbi:MAG TPA: hypothetical protein VM238_10515 [Phycisphaerae bacterium]|nr:hypothetical protein [Phycisphaerae bacterium]
MMLSKEQLQGLVRPLVVKWATRGVLWVMTTWLAVGAANAAQAEQTAGAIAEAIGAVACLILSLLIDRWHHRKDLAATAAPYTAGQQPINAP